jgi:hypothetical protein
MHATDLFEHEPQVSRPVGFARPLVTLRTLRILFQQSHLHNMLLTISQPLPGLCCFILYHQLGVEATGQLFLLQPVHQSDC